MTRAEFSSRVSQMFVEIRDLTQGKGQEYANSDDQLANFKRLEALLEVPREKVAMVLLTKHFDAIYSAIRTGSTRSEPFHGRVVDAILYLMLLDALWHEKEALSPAIDPMHPPAPLVTR